MMSKIKEYFENLVKNGIIPQEPGNYDAGAMEIYIDHLEAENTALHNVLEYLKESMKYKRLTKRISNGKKAVLFNSSLHEGVERLAELEDKIDCGDLIEVTKDVVVLPRIIHPNEMEWHIQYQNEYGIIFEDIRFSKDAAEARLAELKSETQSQKS